MFRRSQIISLVKTKFPKFVRQSSAMPNFAMFLKEKGTVIPFAKRLLKSDEYERYELYRNIKLGNYSWLKEYIEKNSLKREETDSLVEYIGDLKKSSFSAPNVFIGGVCGIFGIRTIAYSVTGMLIPLAGSHILDEYMLAFLSGTSLIGIIGVDIFGLFCIKYGAKVVLDELRAPYYNYDEMIRICNASQDKKQNNNVIYLNSKQL